MQFFCCYCFPCTILFLLAALVEIHKRKTCKKITDIAQKMFNFPFCLSAAFLQLLARFIIFTFISFCQKDFINHLIHFYTNVERFMPEWRFIFTQEIRRNVCFRFALRSQSDGQTENEWRDKCKRGQWL